MRENKKKKKKKIEKWEKKIVKKKSKRKIEIWIFFFLFCPFVCENSLFKWFQKELPFAEFKIPCSTFLFDDEVSYVKKENEDEFSMEECKILILSSNLNNKINYYCNFVWASNYAKYFVLMAKEEFYIKDQ